MQYTNYLRWGILSGIFLIPFVPFIIAQGTTFPALFFPYITGKNFAFRILVELIFFLWVLLALKDPKYRPRGSWVMWTALAFVGWMAVATALSVDPIKSFWSNFERMEGYISLVHVFLWFVVAGTVLSVENLWNRFLNTSIGVSAIMGLYALMQVLHVAGFQPSSQSGARADTSFGNATYLAVYLLIHSFLILFMLSRRRNDSGIQMLYGAALVLNLVGLYFTETRGAILGLIGGLIVAALWMLWQGRTAEWRTVRRYALGGLIAVVVLAGGFFALRNTALVQSSSTLSRLASISLEDRTTISRFQIWQMAGQGFQERPLFGWGQENFNYVFNKYYDPSMYNQEAWFDRAHNQFLDWLIAGGLPAFVLYLGLYLVAAWVIVRNAVLNVGERAALLGLLAGYAFHNLFVFDNLVSAVFFFALLAFLHSISAIRAPSLALSRPVSDRGIAIAAPLIGIAGLLVVWALNAPGMVRAHTLIDAIQTQEAGRNSAGQVVGVAKDPKKNLNEFTEVLGPVVWPGGPLGRQEAVEQYLQFASGVGAQQNINPQTKLDLFTSARDAGNQLLTERKGDARLELFMGTFLGQFGQVPESLGHLQKALEYSPKKQQILIQVGLTLLQGGDKESALKLLKQAYDSAPAFDQARIFYAAGLYYAGRGAEADALLTERFGSAQVDNPQLLQVFMNLKLYDRAIAIWKKRVEASPKDVQVHLGLASTYFAACKIPEVLAELKEIARIEPSAAAEMTQIQKQIQDGTLKCGQ
jgi:O-antigen ligase/tetratricopeptide (TPR) repeat protein